MTVRVLAVYGSETNQTYIAMKDLVDKWKEEPDQKFDVVEFLQGDDAAEKFSEINSTNYDILIVGVSSYGEGDPPGGYGKFLYQLQEAAKADDKPLSGLQHAVLGFGSTIYETYMNCPRLTDKYLGEAGSRRCLERVEVDEMTEVEGQVENWAKEIVKTCVATGPEGSKLDSVCDWTSPNDEILAKTLGEDGFEEGNGVPEVGPAKIIAIVVAIAAISFYWYQNKMNDESA